MHPWFAESVSAHWLTQLEAQLRADRRAFCGECGLDKVARNRASGEPYDFATQLRVFEAQLALAAELQRPLSVHCVQAHGALCDALRAAPRLPRAIALHSFSGKAPLVGTYRAISRPLRERLYFGFSFVVNARAAQRTVDAIRVRRACAAPRLGGVQSLKALLCRSQAVPDDRLLLESDVEDAASVDELMAKLVALVASAKGAR